MDGDDNERGPLQGRKSYIDLAMESVKQEVNVGK